MLLFILSSCSSTRKPAPSTLNWEPTVLEAFEKDAKQDAYQRAVEDSVRKRNNEKRILRN